MKTQHTKGAWKLWQRCPDTEYYVMGGNDNPSAHFAIAIISTRKKEYIANAKLIAAAPDLLAALQLDSMFPATTVVGQQAIEAYSRYLGWKEDMPLENFAQLYRNTAIKKATS